VLDEERLNVEEQPFAQSPEEERDSHEASISIHRSDRGGDDCTGAAAGDKRALFRGACR
jgi:hypothetical protein